MTLTPSRRLALALLWLVLLLGAGWLVGQHLQLSGDLRKFMPQAKTPAQKLLMDELGEGPGSRLLLVALSGDDPATLAQQSQALRRALSASPLFALVANGDIGLDAIPERLRPYRYLLSDTLDTQRLDAATLRDALDARVEDLGSPAASLVEPLVSSDPTLETLKIAESWQPANAPQRLHDVWFDRAGTQALLVAETVAPGFDPNGQQAAVSTIQDDFTRIRGPGKSRLELSGPGAFSVEIGGRTQREAGWIGTVDTIGLMLLLWFAYRSWKAPLLGVLPLASAGLAGLGAVACVVRRRARDHRRLRVHPDRRGAGLSDPSVQSPARGPVAARKVRASCGRRWPPASRRPASRTSPSWRRASTGCSNSRCSRSPGLATAALTTRFLLPWLIDPRPHDVADSPRLAQVWDVDLAPAAAAHALALLALVALAVVRSHPARSGRTTCRS